MVLNALFVALAVMSVDVQEVDERRLVDELDLAERDVVCDDHVVLVRSMSPSMMALILRVVLVAQVPADHVVAHRHTRETQDQRWPMSPKRILRSA